MNSSTTMEITTTDAQIFYKITGLDNERVQFELVDFRHATPITVGIIMNLEDESLDFHSLQWVRIQLAVALANQILLLSRSN